MFNSKRVFGLALLTIASALSGCGGSGGSQADLLVCENGELLLDNGDGTQSCVTRPYVCIAGTQYPEDFVPDADSDQSDCVDIPFEKGPAPERFPAEDGSEVVIYLNRQHVDGLYDGYRIHRWESCWLETPGWPGVSITAEGVDPYYGAYFVVPIDPSCTTAPTNFIINTDGDQTDDYNVIVQSDGLYARMAWVISGDSGGLRGSAGAEFSTGTPICLEDEDGMCTAPPPPARLVVDFAASWVDNSTITLNETGATNVVLYSDADGGGFEQDALGTVLKDGDITEIEEYEVEVEQGVVDENGDPVIDPVTEEQLTEMVTETREREVLCATDACVVDGVVPEGGRLIENGAVAVSALTEDAMDAGTYTLDTALTDDEVKALLKTGLMVAATTSDGLLVGTFVQTHMAIESLYVGDGTEANGLAENADLGLTYADGNVTASVWAPTATEALLKVYSAGSPRFLLETETMTLDEATGVWSVTMDADSVDGLFYLYEVVVPEPFSGELTRVLAADPYSVSASEDSIYSQFIDISSDEYMPAGWDTHTIPAGIDPEDAVAYELHVSELSARDTSVTEDARGKYLAFTESESEPLSHLAALVDAGVTHVNLLPIYDFAGVTEQDGWQIDYSDNLRDFCNRYRGQAPTICPRVAQGLTILEALDAVLELPIEYDPLAVEPYEEEDITWDPTESYEQVVTLMKDVDGYRWGYAPVLFNVPEGSYATDADGSARILETRQMIMALHEMGLRVSVDVAYDRSSDVGMESPYSNLDKLVPGYYFNRDSVTGAYSSNADCCGSVSDTATGAAMFEKFVEESLVHWTSVYKVDSFRFTNPEAFSEELETSALAAVDAVNGDLEPSFTGGRNDALQGALADLALTELFAAEAPLAAQLDAGTITQDEYDEAWAEIDKSKIDRIRVGLAGGLSSFPFYDGRGLLLTGEAYDGTASAPQDNVTFVSAYNTQTLWDMMHNDTNSALTSGLTSAQKADAQVVYLSIPLLSQGSSQFQLGSEFLRSKAGADITSSSGYNAGDLITFIDFTQATHNWGVAEPSSSSSATNATPSTAEMTGAYDKFVQLMAISDSPLFSIESADEVLARVGFHNQGGQQTPGLILMSIDDGTGMSSDLDPDYDAILVAFNGTTEEITQAVNTSEGFAVHPDQTLASAAGASFTEGVDGDGNPAGSFTIPALSTVVFVKSQSGAVGDGLSRDASPAPADGQIGPFGGTEIFIRGSMNGWSDPAPAGNQFQFVGRNKYLVALDLTAADSPYSFKVASQDWATVDLGGDASGVETVLDGGEVTMGAVPDNNLTLNLAADATVYFSLDATDTSAPTLSVETIPYGADIFVRGAMNGWSDPAPDDQQLFYEGRGIYRGSFDVAGNGVDPISFKIASQDWSTVDYGGTASGVTVTFGDPVTLASGVDNNNLAAVFDEASYVFSLDASTPASPVLTVALDNPYPGGIFVRGSMNGWSDPAPSGNELVFQGSGVYAADIEITTATDPESYSFKVASQDWSTWDFGGTASGVSVVVNGDAVELGSVPDNNLGIDIPADGIYRFELDVTSGTPMLNVNEISP